jgi:hypothetical protein
VCPTSAEQLLAGGNSRPWGKGKGKGPKGKGKGKGAEFSPYVDPDDPGRIVVADYIPPEIEIWRAAFMAALAMGGHDDDSEVEEAADATALRR